MELPAEFLNMLSELGISDAAHGLTHAEIPAAIRLNALKPSQPPADAIPVPWCPGGFYLPARPRFTLDPALHQGLYYVQDASSMAHAAAVSTAIAAITHTSPVRYLDACAAPGGKTIAAIDALPRDSFIVANEYDPRRASVLRENVAKHGCGRVVTTCADASHFCAPDSFFDIIAADVPCSGEGMMGKEEAAVTQWSPGLIADCATLQRRIVDNLWDKLVPGGFFIYSTCTFNVEENEKIVEHIINDLGAATMKIDPLERDEIFNAVKPYDFYAYRFLPGKVAGHGQFIALLRKHGAGSQYRVKALLPQRPKTAVDVKDYIDGDFVLTEGTDGLRAVYSGHYPLIQAISKHQRITSAGVCLGVEKGRDFIPSQELALVSCLRPEAFNRINVDNDTALQYLRRNPVILAPDVPRGIVLLTYGGYPLGFVKNIGNRSNNLYPQNWRILH